jgi:hypothetical protein
MKYVLEGIGTRFARQAYTVDGRKSLPLATFLQWGGMEHGVPRPV